MMSLPQFLDNILSYVALSSEAWSSPSSLRRLVGYNNGPSTFIIDWTHVPGILTVLVAALSLLLFGPKYKEGKQPRIPGPRSLPLVGTKWIFWTKYGMNKLHDVYEDMIEKYGPVFAEIHPGGVQVVSVADRAGLEAVLRAPAKRPFRPPTEIVQVYRKSKPERYASAGIVNEQGDNWFHLRKNLTADLTSPQTMQSFLPELNTICDDFIDLILYHRAKDNAVPAIDLLINRMGLESTCALMLGARLGFLELSVNDRAASLAAAVKTNFRAQRDSYFGPPLWKFAPTRLYRAFARSEETIHTIVSELVEEAERKEEGIAQDHGLQQIFRKILENPELDIREKKAGIIDFITAGIETLANSLIFALHLLGGSPSWQKRIFEELPASGAFTTEQLAASPALYAAIQESFRLLPTAPFLARVLPEPVMIGGHQLPAGTFVLAQTRAACRREENFWSAREFRPERWLEVREPHAAALVAPFGRGRRMCPGKRFVELELHLLLAKIVQRFQVEFDGDIDVQFDFLLAPKVPVSLRLVDR